MGVEASKGEGSALAWLLGIPPLAKGPRPGCLLTSQWLPWQ